MVALFVLLDEPFQGVHYSRNPSNASWFDLSLDVANAVTMKEKQTIMVNNRRKQYRSLLDEWTDEKVYLKLCHAFDHAATGLKYIFGERYLPEKLTTLVQPLPITHDPVLLLQMAFQLNFKKQEPIELRMQFEARRLLEVGYKFFDIAVTRNKEDSDPLAWITSRLITFEILRTTPERVRFATWHNKQKKLKYESNTLIEQKPAHILNSDLRRISHNMRVGVIPVRSLYRSPQFDIPIIYQTREKTPMSILRRLSIRKEQALEYTPDTLAVRFIAQRGSDLQAINEAIGARLPTDSITDYKDGRRGASKKKNAYSAEEYEDITYSISLFDQNGHKRFCEIEILTAETHFNVENSAARINHCRYEARQLLSNEPPGLYRRLAPAHVMHVDWTAEAEAIEEYITGCVLKNPRW